MCVALPLDIRVQGTCSGQTCTFFVESRKDARPKKPRRRCSRPCLSKAPHDAAKSTGGVRGVAARRKCAGCAAHFGIRSPDGAALLLFVLFFTALPSRSFFLAHFCSPLPVGTGKASPARSLRRATLAWCLVLPALLGDPPVFPGIRAGFEHFLFVQSPCFNLFVLRQR